MGQYITYSDALDYLEHERKLILAIPNYANDRLENYPFLQHLIKKHEVKFFVYDSENEIVLLWKE